MNFRKHLLNNGLRLITVPIPSLASATLTVWVRTGSRFEDQKTNGLSHFLEHMVFKGSQKRPSAKEISEAVDSIGAEFNAGTAKEWTNFYIKSASANLETAFDVLSDMVINPLLKPEEIEREKGVILQEIAMYEDTPLMKISDVFENLIYSGSSLGWDIAGTSKTVKSIQKNDFVSYRKSYYYPENMLITCSGGIQEKEVLNLVKKYFSEYPSSKNKFSLAKLNFRQDDPKVLLKTKKTDQTHIIIGFRGDSYGSKRRYAEALLSTILGGGMSSRLFIEVRERRGLAYSIKTFSDHAIDNGYLATYAGLRTEKIDEAIAVILEQYYGLAVGKLPVTDQELNKSKEYIKGHLALSLEDTKDVNGFFGLEELYEQDPKTPEQVFKNIDKVQIDEVVAVAKDFFKPEKLNLAIIGPYKDSNRFEKLIRI